MRSDVQNLFFRYCCRLQPQAAGPSLLPLSATSSGKQLLHIIRSFGRAKVCALENFCLQANALIISRPFKVHHDYVPAQPTTKKPTGGPKIKPQIQGKRAATIEEPSKRAGKQRRLILDDSDNDAEETPIPPATRSSPRLATRSAPKIRLSSRYFLNDRITLVFKKVF